MCGGLGGGPGGASFGADPSSGELGMLGLGEGDVSPGQGGSGTGGGGASAVEGFLGVQPGQAGKPTSSMPSSSEANSLVGDVVTVFASIVSPPLGALMAGMADYGAFEGEGGDIGDMGGGPGADPRSYAATYQGPTVAPVNPYVSPPPSITSGVIPPSTTPPMVQFSAERGKSPEEIDAANRLRLERERKYAEQKALAESELMRALSLRDVAAQSNTETRLQESAPSSARFVGLPPTLGQSRHRWA